MGSFHRCYLEDKYGLDGGGNFFFYRFKELLLIAKKPFQFKQYKNRLSRIKSGMN